MKDAARHVWFWQRIVSPHMAGLAVALSRQGCHVTYVAEKPMSPERALQGWVLPDLTGVDLKYASSEAAVCSLATTATSDSIHICQGIRSNGLVGHAQKILFQLGLQQWVLMETVDDFGLRGVIKRLEYRRLYRMWRGRLKGVLAIGHRTAGWLASLGVPSGSIFPFAYFLPERAPEVGFKPPIDDFFRFVFVGQFIERKRLDLLISCLATLDIENVELVVVGSGPLEVQLKNAAESVLPRVRWIGRLSVNDVPQLIAQSDCLVLPSRHDGWGAVVSEAIMVGTPSICSDSCGSAGVVVASGVGGVFRSEDADSLSALLRLAVSRGRISPQQRAATAEWGKCLGAADGSAYLLKIFDYVAGCGIRPEPPWSIVTNVVNELSVFGKR